MKNMTVVAALLASVFMAACAKKESPPETAPAATEAPAPAPAEAAPAEATPAEAAPAAAPANDEDASQTSGDKVAPK